MSERTYISAQELIDSANGGGDFPPLEDGMYEAQVIAVIHKEFDGGNGLQRVHEFIFETADDAGVIHHVRSKSLKQSLHGKSNFFQMMSQWLGKTTADDIVSTLEGAGVITAEGFSFFEFLGRRAKLAIVGEVNSKNGKTYPKIVKMGPAKVAYQISEKSEIPNFYWKDALDYEVLEGVIIKDVTSGQTQSANTSFDPSQLSDDDLPNI